MAAEIKKDSGVDAQLIKGSHGIFDVAVEGKVIYSKANTGRFPNPGEVTALLKQVKK